MDKRVFISIDLPKYVKSYFASLQNPGVYWIKWVRPGNMHITLNFLGDLNPREIENSKKIISNVASEWDPFSVKLERVRQERDMLWIMPGESKEIDLLQEKLGDQLKHSRLGKRERRSYQPHILLGKSKTGRFMKWTPENFQPVEFEVGSINLYESELTPGAATHILIQSFALGGQPPPLYPSSHEGRAGEGS